MPDVLVDLDGIKCKGDASCVGGTFPDPPLDKWPMLAWSPGHDEHGKKVFTEDGAASVEDIAMAACETPDMLGLAARFKTSGDHVSQAIDYALAAGFLGK